MRKILALAFPLLMLCASCGVLAPPPQTDRVLFVGNSLTYVGNTPAVLSALAKANGKPVASDMIVRGGATLIQRVSDGSVKRALEQNRYTALVLQERGGDLMCSFGPNSCAQSQQAIKDLTALAIEHGVRVVLLGTYQPVENVSIQLIKDEASAANDAGIPYIQVSEKLRHLRNSSSGLTWLATDGMHPGKDLALLNAVLVYQALLGSLPRPAPLTVSAPIYASTSGLTENLRRSDDPPPLPDTALEVRYPADTLRTVLAAVSEGGSSARIPAH